MSGGIDTGTVAAALAKACRLDVVAFKPGNVSLWAGGHGMSASDFLASARAAVPRLCVPGAPVGERIERAVEASRAVVDCNTNLGIVLLLAPLAAAAEGGEDSSLRARLEVVLGSLDVADAAAAYRAIRRAAPAGLGRAPDEDVASAPSVGLGEAMALASGRDRVAAQYATVYADVFDIGLPAIARGRERWRSLCWAVTACYLELLAAGPDSHVSRKWGAAVADDLTERMRPLAQEFKACENPRSLVGRLSQVDQELKSRGVNPGTCADLTVASVAALLLSHRLGIGPT
ncbi:MAG: triphosphoribosyl-dephospho-CoA synthase [Gammaproteobacteria bacterium]